jgi:hypothetical protein
MMRVIVQLYRRALKAVTGSDATGAAASNSAGSKTITWNVIKATQSKLINRVTVRVVPDTLISINSPDCAFSLPTSSRPLPSVVCRT